MSENSKPPEPEKPQTTLGPPPEPLLEPNESLQPIPEQNEEYTARLTLVSTVYHQVQGEKPQAFPSQSTRFLDSDEQVYTRHLKVSEDWQALEFGWVKDPSIILLEYPQVKVDNLILQESLLLGVAVGTSDPLELFEIPPGDPFRVYPIVSTNTLFVRYPNGDAIAKVILHAFPR